MNDNGNFITYPKSIISYRPIIVDKTYTLIKPLINKNIFKCN